MAPLRWPNRAITVFGADATALRDAGMKLSHFGLARGVDTVEPLGCIRAGDWQWDAPWRRKGGRRR